MIDIKSQIYILVWVSGFTKSYEIESSKSQTTQNHGILNV